MNPKIQAAVETVDQVGMALRAIHRLSHPEQALDDLGQDLGALCAVLAKQLGDAFVVLLEWASACACEPTEEV
jgi:hypothetical protein